MSKGLIAILLGFGAIVAALLGFFLTGTTSVGAMVFSFLSPALALVGIILAAMEMSSAGERGESTGTAIAALILNLLAFIFGLLIAITCGLCNACASANNIQGRGDFNDEFNRSLQKAMEEDERRRDRFRQQQQQGSGADDQMSTSAAAVQHLTEVCPTSWCAGAWSYEFSGLTCAGGSTDCTLSFTARREGGTPVTTSVPVPRSAATPDPAAGFGAAFDQAVGKALQDWEAEQPAL